MKEEKFDKIYCYPNSDVLINKLNIRDSETLKKYETRIVLAKMYILRQKTENKDYSKIEEISAKDFLNIHKFLFEDVYAWAGKIRNENISKGSFMFADYQYIMPELENIIKKLNNENLLRGLDKENLAKKLAFYMSELNVLHPFREGNGRTIREFIRELALLNGYILDLTKTNSDDIFEASVKSIVDTTDLEDIIKKCLTK